MKIIDNKGKIFGLINLIDLIVILVLGLLVVGGGYKVMKKSPQVITQSEKVIVKVEISEVRQPSVDGIKEGDMLYHYDKGQVFGKIVKKNVVNFQKEAPTSDGRFVLSDVPGKYNVILDVEANATNTTDVVIVGGEHTRIGAQFRLKNKNVAVFSTVLGVEID